MIRIYFILLFFCISIYCSAQSIEKRYSNYLGNNGVINFFHPQKLSKNTNIDMFVYDMTYISHSDSVTVNCSLKTKSPNSIKSLLLTNSNYNILANDLAILYRDVQKRGYEIRFTSRFSFNDIKRAFEDLEPLTFKVILNEDLCCIASYSKSKWEKESLNIMRIFESINF